jgi:hypothetical protein
MKTTTPHRGAEIATEEQSPFRPHRGLAAPNLFLNYILTGQYGSHARLTVWKPWVTYTGTDPDMSPEG